MVLLEAMQYGIPCLAYETRSGVNDLINNNKNGYVIKGRNEKEYINKIDYLLSHDNVLKSFGKEALSLSQKYSKEEILKIWNKILNK